MQLSWQPDESPLAVTGIDGVRVRLGNEWQSSSFWVNARQFGRWAPRKLADVSVEALDTLLAADPEIILVGTGAKVLLLPPALQAHVMRRRCGIECMNNGAAARTYNVLLGEGRAVLAAFLIDET